MQLAFALKLTLDLFCADVDGGGLAPFGIFGLGTRLPKPNAGLGVPISRKLTGRTFCDGV